ncbi:MAG TPA: diaminopimelate decarboxylase, partial [Hellea balneolensis]|nr:diaminopimelate decarboxylase [Hellea balneolensis]
IRTFDVGGGLGIVYDETTDCPASPADYGALVSEKLTGRGLKAIFEPGRMIAGNAGVLLSRVRYIKTGGARNFLILDAAMNDLLRPALYGAHHAIVPVKPSDGPTMRYDVVGPVCESGDTFAKGVQLPKMQEGDLVILRSAGAYGAVQAGQYNTRPLVPEALVDGARFEIIRKRPTIDDMLAHEHIPDWL